MHPPPPTEHVTKVPQSAHRLALYGEQQRMVFEANMYRVFARMLASSTESEVRDPWVARRP